MARDLPGGKQIRAINMMAQHMNMMAQRCLKLETKRYLIKIYLYFYWFYGFAKIYMLGHHIYSKNIYIHR